MTTPSDTIRTRLAFAYEAAETEEDRAWVNEGQEALVVMEGEVERLTSALHAAKVELVDYGKTVGSLQGALDTCRQSLTEQALARADPTMPRLSLDVLERLEGDAEAEYACAGDRDDRVYAQGLSLLCEWQRQTIAQPVGPARAPRLDPPIAPMEIDAGRKLADWLRDRGDTNYAALVDRLVSGLVSTALAQPGDAK